MHLLFVHQNFPAQFGHVASHLVRSRGERCTFVSQRPAGVHEGIELVQYAPKGSATRLTHYCSRTFENGVWHAHAVYEALAARRDIKPDLIVAHSGFGSSLFLRELYDCPIVNYFEYFYHPHHSDMDFRPDFPPRPIDQLRARARNAMLLLDLDDCGLGYCPTHWQHSRLPALYHEKVRVIFDGIDTALWRPMPNAERTIAGRSIPENMHIVTYATRGMESIRGFDIFMRAARLICKSRSDVLFVVVGQDRICYGGDQLIIGRESFRDWVLSEGGYDLDRFVFTGLVPPNELARIFALTDLHIYLTVPFILSWSLLSALACGATVLASDTAPVREVIDHEVNGLLTDFFDIEAMAEAACRVFDSPGEFRPLGQAAVARIAERYSSEVCLPQIEALYEDAATQRANKPKPRPCE